MLLIDKRGGGRRDPTFESALLSIAKERGIEATLGIYDSADVVVAPTSGPNSTLMVGIERKTVSDFIGSLADKRFWGQIERLRHSYDVAYLLLEGPLVYRPTGTGRLGIVTGGRVRQWDFLSITNTLAGLRLLDPPVGIVPTGDIVQSVAWICGFHRLLEKERNQKIKVSAKDGKKSNVHPALLALTAIPGVGPDTARSLLKEFGSISILCASSGDRIRAVRGIGPKLAESILSALGRIGETEDGVTY